MGGTVVLDCETRSTLKLGGRGKPGVSAARYAVDSTTDVWCVAYTVDDGPVRLWLPGDPVPEAIATADIVVAHNASFEIAICRHILVPRYGWPEIRLEHWRCTQAVCLALALPADLGSVAKVLKLTHQKADDKIMHAMSKPRMPRGDEDPAAGPFWFTDPEHLQTLFDYCKADIEAERELYQRLPPLASPEQTLWEFDQRCNDRGVYTDGKLIEQAITIATAAEQAVQTEFQQLTGLGSTSQVEKLQAWLAAHGCEVTDLQKATLSQALRRTALTPNVRRVIELRQEASHAAATKFRTLQTWRQIDGRVRGTLRFHGAATGRWSGNGPQPQNFKRESENIEAKFAVVMSGDLEAVRKLGPPMEVVGDIGRTAICAAPGHRLMCFDYSGMESRGTAFITNQADKLEQWAKFDRTHDPHDEPYFRIGSACGFPEETARQNGKIIDLAFGYGGGVGAYRRIAPEDDTTSDEQIKAYKQAWCARHPQTRQFWYGLNRAAIAAVRDAPRVIQYKPLELHCENRRRAVLIHSVTERPLACLPLRPLDPKQPRMGKRALGRRIHGQRRMAVAPVPPRTGRVAWHVDRERRAGDLPRPVGRRDAAARIRWLFGGAARAR
jgi:DNA polymerase